MRRLIAVLSILLPAAPVAAQSPDMYEGTIRGFLKRLGSDRFRQAHRVAAITYSPDGKHLATADGESIHIWDASDGRRVPTIPFADHEVLSIRHPSDSKSLPVVGYYHDSDLLPTPPGKRPQTRP